MATRATGNYRRRGGSCSFWRTAIAPRPEALRAGPAASIAVFCTLADNIGQEMIHDFGPKSRPELAKDGRTSRNLAVPGKGQRCHSELRLQPQRRISPFFAVVILRTRLRVRRISPRAGRWRPPNSEMLRFAQHDSAPPGITAVWPFVVILRTRLRVRRISPWCLPLLTTCQRWPEQTELTHP